MSKDELDTEIANLKAERDAAFVKGLEQAVRVACKFWYDIDEFDTAIQAEIDKAKTGKS